MLALLLLLQQQPGPTVGDTVWVTQEIRVNRGVSVRPRPVTPSPVVEPLGPPEVVAAEREVTVRYPLVLWQPGRHTIELPGVILVRSDGWSDTLAPAVAAIDVRSVLPGPPSDSIPPRPAQTIVARTSPALLPVLVFLALALLLLLPLHWWWRRKGRPAGRPDRRTAPSGGAKRAPGHPERSEGFLLPTVISGWSDAGEMRVAAEAWAAYLEPRLRIRDDPALQALIERLRAARFSADGQDQLTGLLHEAARAAQGG